MCFAFKQGSSKYCLWESQGRLTAQLTSSSLAEFSGWWWLSKPPTNFNWESLKHKFEFSIENHVIHPKIFYSLWKYLLVLKPWTFSKFIATHYTISCGERLCIFLFENVTFYLSSFWISKVMKGKLSCDSSRSKAMSFRQHSFSSVGQAEQ